MFLPKIEMKVHAVDEQGVAVRVKVSDANPKHESYTAYRTVFASTLAAAPTDADKARMAVEACAEALQNALVAYASVSAGESPTQAQIPGVRVLVNDLVPVDEIWAVDKNGIKHVWKRSPENP